MAYENVTRRVAFSCPAVGHLVTTYRPYFVDLTQRGNDPGKPGVLDGCESQGEHNCPVVRDGVEGWQNCCANKALE